MRLPTNDNHLSWAPRGTQPRLPVRPTLPSDRHAGFSLVELLVVIAIIGSLISLLLPAVQAARESARRLECTNQIRQLAMAVLNYESRSQQLPAAGTYDANTLYYWTHNRIDLRSGTQHSWIVRILPFVEQQTLYDQFDFSQHITSNRSAPQATTLEALLCPSDDAAGRMFSLVGEKLGGSTEFAKGNYAGYASPFHVDDFDFRGSIWLFGQPLRAVTDGLSNTLALSEVRTRDHRRDQRGAWALPWSGASLLAFDMHSLEYIEEDQPAPPYLYQPLSLGQTQMPNGALPDVLYECPDLVGEQIDGMPCTDNSAGYISAAPRSLHPGGVNGAMLDGSVRFVANDADEVVMAYQISINDGRLTNYEVP